MSKKHKKKSPLQPKVIPLTFQNQPQQLQNVVVQQSFSGPLPHPDILKKYEECIPGSAERIIQMAERQSTHRQSLETSVIKSDISRSKWGQVLGFSLCFVALVIAGVLGIYGKTIAASIIGAGTLVSLVSVFVMGKISRKEDLEKSQ